jgi:hypothetical protein
MYKNCYISQLTLPIESETLIPEIDIVQIVNHLVETIP